MERSSEEHPSKRIGELERENEDLREKLRQSQEQLERAQAELGRTEAENERLRKELAAAQRTARRRRGPGKKGNPQRPGRRPGQGPFRRREAPAASNSPQSPPPERVRVTIAMCPCCGGEIELEGVEEVSNTDIAPPEPEVRRYEVEVFRCKVCGRPVRGQHPDVAADQYGATAHRVGPRVKSAAHTLHYGLGVPVRKLPAVFRELKGVSITQGALTQDALRRAKGEVGTAYQILRAAVPQQPTVNTDDTGFSIHGDPAWMMAFDTPVSTVYQIRRRHRNEEVRELIPSDYAGVMGTDRGPSYDAEELLGVAQQKCLAHIQRNITDVVETKRGPAAQFGQTLKGLLRESMELWKAYHRGEAPDYEQHVERLEEHVTHHLRDRSLKDADNQRLLDGIGLHHDRGNLLRFLHEPLVEPTNNRAERALRFVVIARASGQYPKNNQGAEAYAAFATVIRTAMKQGAASIAEHLTRMFGEDQPQIGSP
jgi:transposase